MKNLVKNQTVTFAILLASQVVAAIFILVNRPNRLTTFLIISVLTVFYILWGIVYHQARGDFDIKVILEYFLIGILVILIASVVFLLP